MKQCLVSENSLRFARTFYGALVLLGILLNNFWLVLITGILMALGAFSLNYNLFYQLHYLLSKRTLRDKSQLITKDPNEIRFACGIAAFFLFLSFFFFHFWKLETLAWVLAVIVIFLSLLAGFTGVCVGALMYVFLKKIFRR